MGRKKFHGRPIWTLCQLLVKGLYDLYHRARLWYWLYSIESILLHIFGCQQVWCMIHQLISDGDPKLFKEFRDSQQSENAAVALAGTIIALIAIASMALPSISQVHWIARALWIFSLLSGLVAVLCACNQQMTISRRITWRGLLRWMNDQRACQCEQRKANAKHFIVETCDDDGNVRSRTGDQMNKNGDSTNRESTANQDAEKQTAYSKGQKLEPFAVPDFFAVLLISLPRKVLCYSLEAYMIGLAVYLGFVWQLRLDAGAAPGDSRNIFIFSMVSLVVCWSVFFVSDITNHCKGSVWEHDFDWVLDILNGPGAEYIGVKNQELEEKWKLRDVEYSQERTESC